MNHVLQLSAIKSPDTISWFNTVSLRIVTEKIHSTLLIEVVNEADVS